MQEDERNPIEKPENRSDEDDLPSANAELKLINEALRTSEDRFKAIVHQSNMGIAECDLWGRLHFVNQQFANLLGFAEAELTGRLLRGLLHPDDMPKYDELIATLANGSGAFEAELRYMNAGNQPVWLLQRSSRLQDMQGKFSSFISTFTHISQPKQEEEKWQQDEKSLDILESITDPFFAVDHQWRFIYANRKLEQLNQREPNSLLGKNIWEEFPPLYDSDYGRLYRRVAEERITSSVVATSTVDNQWYEVQAFPAKDGIAAYFKNVTEQKEAEKALQQSEERYSTLIHQATAGVAEMDVAGTYVFVNKKWCEITGFEEEEMYRLTCFDYVHPDDAVQSRQLFEQTVATGRPFINEKRIICKDGTELWINETISGISGVQGEIKSIVSVCIDITDRKTIEKQKDEFIGMVSHELKTPVTSLKAYAQVLQMRFLEGGDLASAGMLQKMEGQINRLTLLVQDLLDVTRLEGNLMRFHREVFEFSKMVADTIEEVQRTLPQHNIVCGPLPKAYVFADMERTSQVLVNLLTNAAKYSPRADRIVVSALIAGSYITCSVKDFGIGIPAESQRYIFDRFYRVNNHSRNTYPGLGLGLYISSEIVKKQQGDIWFDSLVNEGSVFSFRLPLYHQS